MQRTDLQNIKIVGFINQESRLLRLEDSMFLGTQVLGTIVSGLRGSKESRNQGLRDFKF
jgi:hypothetical protein